MSLSRKLPAMQFYPGDWRKDVGIQSLDYFERGVWFEVLCLMHESEDRGRLVLNGRAMPDDAVARVLGLLPEQWVEVRQKLVAFGVASEDDEGVIYNRRMTRDEKIRRVRAEAGRRGGTSGGRPKQKESKKPANAKQTPEQKPSKTDSPDPLSHQWVAGVTDADGTSKPEAKRKQSKPPSSSSSVSTSITEPPLTGAAAAALEALSRRGGMAATHRTLTSRFLYPDDEADLADPSVKGLPYEARLHAVSVAVIEMADQGGDWSPRRLAAFIRREDAAPAGGKRTGFISTDADYEPGGIYYVGGP